MSSLSKKLAVRDKELAVDSRQLAVNDKKLAVDSRQLAVMENELAVGSRQLAVCFVGNSIREKSSVGATCL